MYPRQVHAAGVAMTDDANEIVELVTERYERRLSEETGAIRLEMASGFGQARAELVTECGGLRTEMAQGFGEIRTEMAHGFGAIRTEMAQGLGAIRTEMAQGLGAMRTEMSDRNTSLLRWLLVFGVTQTAAVAGIVSLLR